MLRDLVPFVQFKKREKYPWGSLTFSKVASSEIGQMVPNHAAHHIRSCLSYSDIKVWLHYFMTSILYLVVSHYMP